MDRIEVAGLRALGALGVQMHNGQEVTEFARMIKGPDEILAMHVNADMVRPGVRFTELSRNGHCLPQSCRAQRYGVMFHGVELCDEYPCIRYPEDLESYGYEGALQAGMALCVEAYVGVVGGRDGIKLENPLLVTETGFELLTHYPFEDFCVISG
ncbi:M24 family metallopeptidase [Pseudomonas sp. NBRC 111123]|uniref:M24 family metallopeptidase n=1 Tax=Pseudomonas sp. NBRC 111123 TaxID=1661038 RepID=UPI000761E329|nr:M24 family metallopeptidase [Pseudomonas sp. NBRC 111123]